MIRSQFFNVAWVVVIPRPKLLGSFQLWNALWFTVDEVIHHDDVMFPIIIRTRGSVAASDAHPRNARVARHNAEEGKAPVARRGGDEAAEQQLAIDAEVLNQRAGLAVAALAARPAPIRQVNIREDRAKTIDRLSIIFQISLVSIL
jgi:hypothetical protein